jgi:hypothetical protein
LFTENWALDFNELTTAFRVNFKPVANKDVFTPTIE